MLEASNWWDVQGSNQCYIRGSCHSGPTALVCNHGYCQMKSR